MTTFISVDVGLDTVNCGVCGGTYAINARYRQKKKETGGYWNCPYCQTSWGYGDSEIKELHRRLTQEQAAHDQTRAELSHTERRRRGEKAAKTRLQNRAAAGVCPCCKRHFTNLERHIKSKHPAWPPAEIAT